SVTVTRERDGAFVLRIRIASGPQLTSGLASLGIEAELDLDGDSAGDPTMRPGLGVDRVATVVDGKPHLVGWRHRGGRRARPPPHVRLAHGTATIEFSPLQVRRARCFRFAVSVASGLQPAAGGQIDITNARFDFAPNVGQLAWIFPCR